MPEYLHTLPQHSWKKNSLPQQLMKLTSPSEPACQCRRHKRRGFDPCVWKIPRRRKWQPTPVFLPAESMGYSSLGCRVVQYVKQLCVDTSIKVNQTTFWGYIHHLLWPTLNKSTSYLSFCLSLNSFCDEPSRTWLISGSETRSVISVGRSWVGFEFQLHGLKSQAGFWPSSSPSLLGLSSKLGFVWV